MSTCIRRTGIRISLTIYALAQAGSAQPTPTGGFTIAILQGDGILNALPRPPLTRVSIRVANPKGQPIRDAVAVFQFPEAGASAAFPDGSVVKVLLTNTNGEAVVELKSNEVPGKFEPTVTVNYLGQSSMVKLHQENAFPYVTAMRPKRSFLSRLKKPIGIAAAAGALGAVTALTRQGGSTTPPSNGGITITPSTGTVGGR
jgi:hypothetical protein